MRVRRTIAVPWLLLALSCGPSAGTPLEPGSLALRIEANGDLLLAGRSITPSDLPAAAPGARLNTEPVVLDADPSLTFQDLKPLLFRLIGDCNRVNLGFRLRGDRVLTVPIPLEHCMCRSLSFHDGRRKYDEHGKGWRNRLWIRLRPQPGGSLKVEGVDDIDPGTVEMSAVEDPLYRKDEVETAQEARVPARPPPPRPKKQVLPRPRSGSTEDLRRFFLEPGVIAARPFADLEIRAGDRVGDALQALAEIRKAAGEWVTVSLRLGPP